MIRLIIQSERGLPLKLNRYKEQSKTSITLFIYYIFKQLFLIFETRLKMLLMLMLSDPCQSSVVFTVILLIIYFMSKYGVCVYRGGDPGTRDELREERKKQLIFF